jgi:hypothetical protein
MARFRETLRLHLANNRNRESLIFFGSGFVDFPPGRVYLPLIGCPRVVPSSQEELRFDAAFPRWWQVIAFVVICMIIGAGSINGVSLAPAIGKALFPCSVAVAIAIWCWRERALIREWQKLERRDVGRSTLLLTFLKDWSLFELTFRLVFLMIVGVWVLSRLQPPSLNPPSAAEPGRWFALALICLGAFAFLRAICWLTIALTHRVRRRPV